MPPVSWDQILAFSRAIRFAVPDPDVDVFEAVPHGMFLLDYEVEGTAIRKVIHVYDHQRTCWEALFLDLSGRSPADFESLDIKALDENFFGPHHDLPKLLAEMLARGSQLLGQPLEHGGSLEWSKRIIKGWFGVAHSHGAVSGRIRINCLLDSPDFSAETLRFLLWHEFLHIHLKQGHTEEFRRLERLWPDHSTCNREMDALNEKFGVQYW